MAYSLVISTACMCIITCYVSAAIGPRDCRAREYFEPNYDNCALSCLSPIKSLLGSCLTQYYPACVCKKEYIRDNITGGCVLPSQCTPRACSRNEHFEFTIKCDKTCEHPAVTEICSSTLIPMCLCNEGTYRNVFGECVPFNDCTPKYHHFNSKK